MAKYGIDASCGHGYEVQLTGKMDARYSRIERLTGEPCPDCRKQAHQDTNACAAEWAASMGLPPLLGSVKQAGWAESIRREILSVALHVRGGRHLDWFGAIELGRTEGTPEALAAVDALEILRGVTSASWWIENRAAGNYAGAARRAREEGRRS